jgi:N6-adenosine-specific RNA methylase IME4
MKKYKIIYADPPWKYANERDNDPAQGGMTYPTMTVAELSALKINDISDKDSTLFMWVTMPKLKEGLEVMEAWGFRYITCAFTWVKLNPKSGGIYSGMGHWTNGNAEICLLGKKGKGTPRVEKNVKQIVLAPRGKHSAKPPEVRDRIVRLVGDLPRVELFAREVASGWSNWGNEIETEITL